MKKLLIISLIYFAVSGYNLTAQSSYLGFSLGASIPKGPFVQSEDLFSNGYAIPGFTICFEGFYYPFSILGFGGTLGFGSLYADQDVYLDHLVEYLNTQSSIPGISITSADEVNFESGFWNYVNLLVGPEISVPLGRFQAGIRGLGGITAAFCPSREMSYIAGSEEVSFVTKGSSVALAYSYGGSILYKSRSGTGIKVSADYFNSNSSYDSEIDVTNVYGEYEMDRTDEIDTRALSLTLGFFYFF